MATYGQVRLQLQQLLGGASLDLIDGWLQDRYQMMLDRLEWDRTETRATIQTEAEYATGTAGVTAGSIAITLAGGSWSQGLDRRVFRVAEGPAYSFVFVGAAAGRLDRMYEGATDAAAGYRLNRAVYSLPPDCRVLNQVRMSGGGELARLTMAEVNELYPDRINYGTPEVYIQRGDEIEFYPIPVVPKGVIFDYTAEQVVPDSSGVTLLPWIRPGALKAGVQADAARFAKDYTGGREFEMQYEKLMNDMLRISAEREGPVQLRPGLTTTQRETRRNRTRY
jgi:hypothetical protein